jgi:hypothetical protein
MVAEFGGVLGGEGTVSASLVLAGDGAASIVHGESVFLVRAQAGVP